MAPLGPKGSKWGQIKTKRQDYTFKTKVDRVHEEVPRKFLELILNPTKSPTGLKKGPKWTKLEMNIYGYTS